LAALLGACVGFAGTAFAKVKVIEQVKHYQITGTNGLALLRDMDGRGPKHGFLTRAIAQTAYSVAWKIEWAQTRGACRVKSVDGKLSVTYKFPQVAGKLSPHMQRRWRVFFAGVKRHERTHGDLARRMASATEKSIRKATVQNDPGCRKTRSKAKRLMADIYADYEARQVRFDVKEHSDGGAVERLIDALVQSGGV
jgi:predicted secreted Zn-dependent protease